ncbi:MAG: pyridoxamine 5'-phosphate oxidase family protein [Haloarculaceae archaeon]
MERDDASGGAPAGPTLYLESDRLDPTEAFCSSVFEDAEGEYRVVQLTARQSFDSLRDALDVQLERIHDPSEAAVIITTPRDETESAVSSVGEGTPLYGFRVDPQDLTGISIAFSRVIQQWEDSAGTVRICLRDIESLLPYHDADLVYRFLNTVLATLQGSGAEVHAHLRPAATDEETLQLLASLFATVVEAGATTADAGTDASTAVADADSDAATATTDADTDASTTAPDADEAGGTPTAAAGEVTESTIPGGESTASGPGAATPGGTIGDPFASTAAETVAMSDEAIDGLLASAGHGVLAFDGSPPYALPMSFGYDACERVLYLQLATHEDSEKARRLADSSAVSLVVTEYERPDRWHSVVVDGTLSRLSPSAVRERHVLETFAAGDLASVDVFDRDPDDLTFEWYVLEPASFSGRRGVGAR